MHLFFFPPENVQKFNPKCLPIRKIFWRRSPGLKIQQWQTRSPSPAFKDFLAECFAKAALYLGWRGHTGLRVPKFSYDVLSFHFHSLQYPFGRAGWATHIVYPPRKGMRTVGWGKRIKINLHAWGQRAEGVGCMAIQHPKNSSPESWPWITPNREQMGKSSKNSFEIGQCLNHEPPDDHWDGLGHRAKNKRGFTIPFFFFGFAPKTPQRRPSLSVSNLPGSLLLPLALTFDLS